MRENLESGGPSLPHLIQPGYSLSPPMHLDLTLGHELPEHTL